MLGTLVIPQGYTLSVAGGFAAAISHYGSPTFVQAWGFASGAVLAFVLLLLWEHTEAATFPSFPSAG